MAFFWTPLEARSLSDGRHDMLIAPLIWETDKGEKIVIPKGFITDYASIPQCFWWLTSPMDRHKRAAVLHDFLYSTQGTSRKTADDWFLQAMKDTGVEMVERRLIFTQVRLWGWIAWNKHAKEIE